MSVARTKSGKYFVLLGAIMALLIVACGPAAPVEMVENPANAQADRQTEPIVAQPSNTEERVEAAEVSVDTQVEAQPEAAANPGRPVNRPDISGKAGSEQINADGIPVGFTTDGHPYVGNIDADVVIQEWSDYQCPFCGRFFSQTMGTLKSAQIKNGEAVLIFYDFPLSFHAQAAAASNAARCAGEQGAIAYWDMHDIIFTNLGNWSVNDPSDIFIGYGSQIGIDTEPFGACVRENRYAAEVQADMQAGQAKGVRGTPAFLVNGELLSGAQPYAAFDTAITRARSGESIVAAPEPVNVEDIPVPEPIAISDDFGGAMGDPNAPVVVVEYTDYQCPFCSRHSAQTMPEIISKYVDSGDVYYILKDLPLDSLHPAARGAAVAARCAGEQDVYWEMHDQLFATQQEWGQSPDANAVYTGYAEALGIDTGAYSTCLTSGKYDALIEANVQEAQAAGIGGTPFFVVQGFPVINGAQPINVFDEVIGYAKNNELVTKIQEAQAARAQQQAQQQPAQQPQQPAQPTGPVDVPIGADDIIIGDPDAPVTIVEYTDYQCPYCQRHFSQTYVRIKQDYVDQGIVRYVFKDFPLSFHPQADEASQAARCANDQGQFLSMHDKLFTAQKEWSGQTNANAIFVQYATDLGLDTATFDTCLNSGKYVDIVNAGLQEGSSLGVRGTPAFFVNGQFVNGAQPFQVFQQAIAAATGESDN